MVKRLRPHPHARARFRPAQLLLGNVDHGETEF